MTTGRKDSLDLDVEVASSLASGALETGGSSDLEDMLLLLQQADELHQGSEHNKRKGFQLLLNNKLAVRLQLFPFLLCALLNLTLPGNEKKTKTPTWFPTQQSHMGKEIGS